MQVIIDGGEPIEVGNDVKVIHEEQLGEQDGEEIGDDLHLTMTHEGIICDFVHQGEVAMTNALDLDCIIEDLK